MSEFSRKLLYVPYVAYRQARWLLGDRSPFATTLKLTTRCTLACDHCPWLQDPRPDLPTARWKEIIRQMRERGSRHLVLEGGEPTLRGDLQKLIEWAQAMGMKVTVATNGTRPLGGYSPDRFLVSVDGLEAVHDQARGRGAFGRMLANLPTATAPVIALVSLSRENVHQIEGVLEYFTPRLDGFWFSFVYDYGDGEGVALSAEQKRQVGRTLLTLRRRYPIINAPSYLQRVGTKRPCADWLVDLVPADGSFHAGCMIEAVEPCRCDDCELACHREFSDFVDPRAYPSQLRQYLQDLGSRR